MTGSLAPQERDAAWGSARVFGDVGGYAPCGCCGGFHAVFEEGGGPFGSLNADERGGLGANGKVSLTPAGAGQTITRSNVSWATALGQPGNVTFAFRSTEPGTMPDDTTGFSRFSDVQINATLTAMAAWSEVANITFTRVADADGYSNSAVMLFGNYSEGSEGAAAFAYMPPNRSLTANSGDVWIKSALAYNANPVLLGYGQQVLVHEIGHAIGLSHPAGYNAGPGQSLTYAGYASYYEDSRQYSVMSYFSETNTGGSFGGRYASAPLLDDIAAVQRLYGANLTTRTGDTTYGFNSNAGQAWFSAASASTALIFAAWDAGGTDTFDFSGYTTSQVIDLRQGAFSNVGSLIGNVSIALGAVIENAIGGSGADYLGGNSGDNILTGGLGNDTIEGGLGIDTAVFSGPRSAYTISWNGRQGTVTGPDGTDTLYNVEFLRFSDQTIAAEPTGGIWVTGDLLANTLTGTAFADVLVGGAGNDTLEGGAGNDYLGGGYGDDIVNGGDGDDHIFGDPGSDTLNGGAGIDRVDYSAGIASPPGAVRLLAGVNVDLSTGRATGGGGNDILIGIENVTGTEHNDVLRGDAGANAIHGGGGADQIFGGGGNDILSAGTGALIGGAPDIVKGQATSNGGIASAISLDGGFDLLPRSDVNASGTVPHATILATAHAGIEYYAFTVAAGGVITLDIDGASFDSTVRLLDAAGAELASNDDSDPDGVNPRDAQLSFTAPRAGVYYAAVGLWDANVGSTFTTKAMTPGSTYTLHVSVTGHSVVPLTEIGSRLYGEAGDDQLFGGPSHDYLNGGAGNDTLVGGGGVDTAGYGGGRRQYVASSTSVAGNGEGSDTLIGIENVSFIDGILTFDVDSLAAQLMRLYDAAFDRMFDPGGFEANLDALEAGVTLNALAGAFLNSAEFQARYGALSNQAFVEQLYRFTLNREGDPGGIQTWLNALNSGASRTDILVAFSESQEHRNLTVGALNAGLWVADNQATIIARLYDATFDRLPDVGGLAAWTDQLKAGVPLFAIAGAFASSAEFQARYGALTNQSFVEQLYRFCLDREGDPGGIQTWVNALNAGATRAQILATFSESAEHIALTAPLWLGGIRFEGVASYVMEPEKSAVGLLDDDFLPGLSPLFANDPEPSLSGVDDDVPAWEAAVTPAFNHGHAPGETLRAPADDDLLIAAWPEQQPLIAHGDWIA